MLQVTLTSRITVWSNLDRGNHLKKMTKLQTDKYKLLHVGKTDELRGWKPLPRNCVTGRVWKLLRVHKLKGNQMLSQDKQTLQNTQPGIPPTSPDIINSWLSTLFTWVRIILKTLKRSYKKMLSPFLFTWRWQFQRGDTLFKAKEERESCTCVTETLSVFIHVI